MRGSPARIVIRPCQFMVMMRQSQGDWIYIFSMPGSKRLVLASGEVPNRSNTIHRWPWVTMTFGASFVPGIKCPDCLLTCS